VIFSTPNFLGIAMADRTIAVAELSAKADKRVVRRTATLTLATDETLDRPDTVGRALASFLKDNGFSTDRVVVGVPAKWVIAVEKEVPPASGEQLRALLRLQAERMSAAESGEMVFDYAGTGEPTRGGKVLMVAMMRKQLGRIEQAMSAAGLDVAAITPMSLALASAAKRAPVLMVARHGAEVVWQGESSPRMLRHVSIATTNGHGTPAIAPLGLELRRTVAMAAPGNGAASEMVLFDTVGLSDSQLNELTDRMGVKFSGADELSVLGVQSLPQLGTSETSDDPPRRYAPAVALALLGAKRELLTLDFADSKLAPPTARRFGRRTVWAAGIAAVIVIGIAALFIHVNLLQRQLNGILASQDAIKLNLDAAQSVKDRVDFSNGFFKTRTPMLDAWREIAETFPQDDPIWATSFTVGEDPNSKTMGTARGRLEGKTTNMRLAIELSDRMRQNPRFSNVSVPAVTEVGGRQRDQSSFTITFQYTPEK
jgi:hypothetical protein